MRCPALNELPLPPPGKTGWPWTEETPQLPENMPDSSPWPRISIVTPSFNQGQFIEETIRSVLLQGYPNLEYIIIDGGSTDGSVEIIKKYEPWLAYWVSEIDNGQANAINKGIDKATGQIFAWINSDDLYDQNAFLESAKWLKNNPYIGFVYSDSKFIDLNGRTLMIAKSHQTDLDEMIMGNVISQQTVFYNVNVVRKVGKLREDLHMILDFEFWLRILKCHNAKYISGQTGRFRLYQGTKTMAQEYRSWQEIIQLFENHIVELPNALRQKGQAYAYFMASLCSLNEGLKSLAIENIKKSQEIRAFSKNNLPFYCKRTLAFLKINQLLHRPLVSVEQIESTYHRVTPSIFIKRLKALSFVRSAEQGFKDKQWNVVRKNLLKAVILWPNIIIAENLWPFFVSGILGSWGLELGKDIKSLVKKLVK